MKSTIKSKIMFVDDESQVLSGLRRMLRKKSGEWDLEFVSDPVKAAEMVASDDYNMVVSDMRMPKIDGAELLMRVKKVSPQTIRIVLSGQASKEAMFRAIGPAHKYLSKPCSPERLVSEIERSLRLHSLLQDGELKKVLSSIDKLPSLPVTYRSIMDELQKPDPSIEQVSNIVSKDIAMGAKILGLINSSFFGLPRQIDSIRDAVGFLGLETIKMLALVMNLFKEYQTKQLGSFSPEKLFKNSLLVGCLSKKIYAAESPDASPAQINNSFLGGAFHDVGQLVFAENFTAEYENILIETASKPRDLPLLERERFGADHALVGAYLLGQWSFGDALIEAVAYHHSLDKMASDDFSPYQAIYIADLLIERDAGDETPLENFGPEKTSRWMQMMK